MKPLSLFNAPVCKSLSLLALILLLAFSGSDSSAMDASIDGIRYFETDCTNYMQIGITGSLRWTTNDIGITDYMAMVVYDAYGNAIVYTGYISLQTGQQTFGVGTGIYFVQTPVARPFTVTFYDTISLNPSLSLAETFPVLDSFSFDPADFGMCLDLPHYPPLSNSELTENPSFRDGRINNFDMAAPVVAYGHDFETGRGLVVYSPEGALLLEVHPEAIVSVEDCPAENTLILRSGDVALYRLSSCLYQLNAPSLDGTKTYVLIFDSLYTPAYISYEE
jgi:hypothetical protein